MTVCDRCNDTHMVTIRRDGEADTTRMCTSCQSLCQKCRAGGNGAYCEHTPCDCECHGPKPLPSLRERALRVIEVAFGGEHHVGRVKWGGTERYPDCKFSVYGTMASWDDSRLTRLVVAAHDECVRAAVRPMPQGLVVELSDRWRTGKNTIADTCPTLEAHVAAIRGGRAAIMELCESMREP